MTTQYPSANEDVQSDSMDTNSLPTAGVNDGIPSWSHALNRPLRNRIVEPPEVICTPSPVKTIQPQCYGYQLANSFVQGSTRDYSVPTWDLADRIPHQIKYPYPSPPSPPRDIDFGSSLAGSIGESHQQPYYLQRSQYQSGSYASRYM